MKKYSFKMNENNNVTEVGIGSGGGGVFFRQVFDEPVTLLPPFTVEIEIPTDDLTCEDCGGNCS